MKEVGTITMVTEEATVTNKAAPDTSVKGRGRKGGRRPPLPKITKEAFVAKKGEKGDIMDQ